MILYLHFCRNLIFKEQWVLKLNHTNLFIYLSKNIHQCTETWTHGPEDLLSLSLSTIYIFKCVFFSLNVLFPQAFIFTYAVVLMCFNVYAHIVRGYLFLYLLCFHITSHQPAVMVWRRGCAVLLMCAYVFVFWIPSTCQGLQMKMSLYG